MARKRLVHSTIAALALGASGWWVLSSGLQTCAWADRLSGISGCRTGAAYDGVLPARGGLSTVYDSTGNVILAAELRTADGWLNGLIRLNPGEGTEAGRYPLPMTGPSPRLFASPDGQTLLITCGMLEGPCTDRGGMAVSTAVDDLRHMTDYPLEDRYLTTFPGTLRPDAGLYGDEAFYAMDGRRILTARGGEGLVLRDADGRQVAELGHQSDRPFVSLSPDGSLLAKWRRNSARERGDQVIVFDLEDGAPLLTVDGTPRWSLGAQPIWASDSQSLYTPRFDGERMQLDQFLIPGSLAE